MRILLALFIFFFAYPIVAAEQLIIEPDMGRAPILSLINNSKNSLNLVMYGFTDSELLNAIKNAKKSGKKVEVLLEPHPYKAAEENIPVLRQFRLADIATYETNPFVDLTHQKTLITDQAQALIMTFNFTHSTFEKERNFALLIDDPSEIKEISRVFNADVNHHHPSVNHPNLVWSPDNSREKILTFINQAQSKIKIYAQSISDYQIVGALAKAARAGKQVEIIMPQPQNNQHNGKLNYLRRAGVQIHSNKSLFIHAKVIIIDDKEALLGSINLTKASLENNRELSILTHDPAVIAQLLKVFKHDWTDNPFFIPAHARMKQFKFFNGVSIDTLLQHFAGWLK